MAMPTNDSVYADFEDDDDFLHEHGTHPWSTETWWFSFFSPERGIGGWLYALVRPNQLTTAGGAWIWDCSGSHPQDARYFANYTSLPTRLERLRERDMRFPSGLSVTIESPGHHYRLRYADPDSQLEVDVAFRGTTPPFGHKDTVPPFERSSHFDQVGRVTGSLVLDGELIHIDCHAMRDRSWGLRSERVAPTFSYCWMADADEAFLVYAPRVAGDLVVNRGILYRDSQARPLVDGMRTEKRDSVDGRLTAISIEAADDIGRTIRAQAKVVSRLVHPRPISTNTISVLEWSSDRGSSWGEDQDVWPHAMWRERKRRERTAGMDA